MTTPIEMLGPVDLHLHTRGSDGDLEPEELVNRCASAGLRTIAVTDHNSLHNVARAGRACQAFGLQLIAACELSTQWNGSEQHCLAYFVATDDPLFGSRIETVRRADLARSRAWVDAAAEHGFTLRWQDVEAEAGSDRVVPFAIVTRLLLQANPGDERLTPYRDDRRGMWADWFAPGRPLAVDPPLQPSLADAIGWVREAGGVPVLAHPARTLGKADPDAALSELRGLGLGGVEAWTTWHTPEQSAQFSALAIRHGLAITAGSDFHGPTVKPWVKEPGQVTNNGPERLEELLAAR